MELSRRIFIARSIFGVDQISQKRWKTAFNTQRRVQHLSRLQGRCQISELVHLLHHNGTLCRHVTSPDDLGLVLGLVHTHTHSGEEIHVAILCADAATGSKVEGWSIWTNYSGMPRNVLEGISPIERLSEIDKIDQETLLVFQTLFDDGAQDKDLLYARQATGKSGLFLLEFLVHGLMSSEEDNAKHLAPNQEECDSLPEL